MKFARTTLWGGLVLSLLASGCRLGGERSVSEENDRLRAQAIEKDEKIAALERERNELNAKLAEAVRDQQGLSADVLAAVPRVASLTIETLSGFDPVDAKKPATGVVVSFQTRDGRGRFVHAVGTATVEALTLPANVGGTEATPVRIARHVLGPAQLRDAYRSAFTGTHYTVEVPLDTPVERLGDRTPTLVLRVEFQDALTGQVHRAEKLVSPPGTLPPRETRR